VTVVGGANSAGQAALALAASACHVRLVCGRTTFGSQMSSYLVDRIVEDPRIDVHTGTQVVAIHGDDDLQRVTLSGAVSETVDCRGLFCFIGRRAGHRLAR
jgi:thioredoxin reductase (NADPH)